MLFRSFTRVVDYKDRPVAGARLLARQRNSDTPFTLYADEALTKAHPRPLLTGDDGSFPAIYVTGEEWDAEMQGPDGEIMFTREC